jgi:hypothetical protein
MKVMKWVGLILCGFLLSIILIRGCFFETGNLIGNITVLKEIKSPNENYVLTVYKGVGPSIVSEGGGITVFNLKHKNEKLVFIRNNLLTGQKSDPEGNVLVMDGSFFPYGIVWLDNRNLLINLKYPIEQEHQFFGHTVKMYRKKKDIWGDVKVSFGILDSKKYPNEVRIND